MTFDLSLICELQFPHRHTSDTILPVFSFYVCIRDQICKNKNKKINKTKTKQKNQQNPGDPQGPNTKTVLTLISSFYILKLN